MDLFKNNVVAGIGLAFAATVLAPVLLPAMGRIGRPLAKSLVRGGMMMAEKGREALAVASESVEDLMAEVRAEGAMASAPAQPAAPADAAQSPAAQSPAAPEPARPYGGNGSSSGAHGPDAAVASSDSI